jgi:hypothetical protein
MFDSVIISLLVVGFLGGTHCVGMCGGIVSALSFQAEQSGSRNQFFHHLIYSVGRISSYVVAGAIVGAIGQAGVFLVARKIAPFHYFLANLMLVALGLYLMGFTRFLAPFEHVGGLLWQKIQPIFRTLLPAKTIKQMFAVGFLWGWLPCGLVYSSLALAMTTGSVVGGMYAMLAFGVGTLPALLLVGVMSVQLRAFTQKRIVRVVAGLIVLLFGAYGCWFALGKILA